MPAMLPRVKQTLARLALALALFACIWVSRVFLAGEVVGSVMPLAGVAAVAWIAVVGGLIPALPLGFAYGFMSTRNVLAGAIVVAVLACVFELAAASVAVPWWKFVTWWVLPLECVTVLLVFLFAAWAGSQSLPRVLPVVRFRVGLAMFVLLTVGVVTWPWLYGCIRFNVCSIAA
jgi:hypothetical protein